jgi:autotransporter strand-loop-strand O-heptosyltransferase
MYNIVNKLSQSGKLGIVYLDDISELDKCKTQSEKFRESDIDVLCVSELDFDNYFEFDFYLKSSSDKSIYDFCINNNYNRLVFLVENNFEELNILNLDLEEFKFAKNKILNIEDNFEINISFYNGARVEILGKSKRNFKVTFINQKEDKVEYTNYIGVNNWCCSLKSYCIDWLIRIEDSETGELIKEEKNNLTGKKVLVSFDSASLGDSIAWISGVEEFRKKWNCNVYLSTFKNHLFKSEYPQINFIEPGSIVNDIHCQYNIGWYYTSDNQIDFNRTPVDPKTRPLQATSFDILSVDYVEVKSKVKKSPIPKLIDGDYICIAPHSTAQSKYWNNPNGWSELINHFKDKGFEIICVSREGKNWMGNILPDTIRYIDSSAPFDELSSYIQHSKLFIGLSSGISWLSWALGTPTTIISGFSDPFTEPQDENIIRIFNPSVCNSCFNRHRLDPGDWNWCPDKKGTEEQFICSKSISSETVIKSIENWFIDSGLELYTNKLDLTNNIETNILKSLIGNKNYRTAFTNIKDISLKYYLFEGLIFDDINKVDVVLFEGPISIGYHVYKGVVKPGGYLIFLDVNNSNFWNSLTEEKIEITNTKSNKKIGVISL